MTDTGLPTDDARALIERLEMFADHGAPTMEEAQEIISDALLEIRRRTAPVAGRDRDAGYSSDGGVEKHGTLRADTQREPRRIRPARGVATHPSETAAETPAGRTATIVIPAGYKTADEFAIDCGFELVAAETPAAIAGMRYGLAQRVVEFINENDPFGDRFCANDLKRIEAQFTPVDKAWLIERDGKWFGPQCTRWEWEHALPGCEPPWWTNDANKALRFSRREDAEFYIRFEGYQKCIATEHIWLSTLPAPVTAGMREALRPFVETMSRMTAAKMIDPTLGPFVPIEVTVTKHQFFTARATLALPAGRVGRDQRTSEGDWQSIETAPRDGTRLLGTGGGLEDTIEVIAYNERAGAWNTENLTLDDRDDDAEGYNRPTHWQLLPAPPSQSTGER